MFKKILIANRGEIACRVISTARRMGIRTVAVYSEADQDARHVTLADEAVPIGPAPSRESYLDIARIVRACKESGAEAVHPGYGFLSENAEFCEALEKAGIVFIGPTAAAMGSMGDKIASKRLAKQAGVSTIPGYDGVVEDAEVAIKIAKEIGYPVMIKASAGGGGKGLRVARNDGETREGFAACRSEALSAFGDGRLFVEKFIEGPHHIEIQVLGDARGNVVYLGERECSIQRRHQKLLEEAPSPLLDAATREAMGRQAVALAKAVGYRSAGTVEFVVDERRNFYFLEMNTRLQVEHPVTEMITGLDLVEQMIRVAAGEALAFSQEDVKLNGWAIECRVNAEDPLHNFLPSVGRLVKYQPPRESPGAVRVDSGVYEGGEIPIYYDSMMAKLIAHGDDRAQAIDRMREALDSFVIRGVASNVAFHAALMRHPRFVSGSFTTAFMAEEYPRGFSASELDHDDPFLIAGVAAFARRRYIDRAVQISGQLPGHRRKVGPDWVVTIGKDRYAVAVNPTEGGCSVVCEGETHEIRTDWRLGEVLFNGSWDGKRFCLQMERVGWRYRIFHRGVEVDVEVMTAHDAHLLSLMPDKPKPDLSKFLLSPMPGLLVELSATVGQEVKGGERLAVVEAMKMENILRAEQDGVVAEVLAKKGDNLAVDQIILRFE